MSYALLYARDYPINNLSAFEGYLFVSTDRWKEIHQKFAGKIRVVDESGKQEEFSCEEEDRDTAKKRFNKVWKTKGMELTQKSRIGCLLIDLKDESGEYKEDEYVDIADELSEIIADWAAKENYVCVIVPHLYQKDGDRGAMRLPHLHVIYEKRPREQDALTKYLDSVFTD